VERLSRIDGEDDQDSLAVAVIVLRNGLVLVLSCSVPNLEFYSDTIEGDDLKDIIDSNGHHVIFDKLAFAESEQQVTLAHSGIPDYYDLL
jgi:hypothetical protein